MGFDRAELSFFAGASAAAAGASARGRRTTVASGPARAGAAASAGDDRQLGGGEGPLAGEAARLVGADLIAGLDPDRLLAGRGVGGDDQRDRPGDLALVDTRRTAGSGNAGSFFWIGGGRGSSPPWGQAGGVEEVELGDARAVVGLGLVVGVDVPAGVDLAVTESVTVSPGFASAGVTLTEKVASLGRVAAGLSFLAGLGSAGDGGLAAGQDGPGRRQGEESGRTSAGGQAIRMERVPWRAGRPPRGPVSVRRAEPL